MRIERTGKVEKLTPRVERFMMEELGGASLDCMQSPEARRVDYVCLNGLLAIEVKSLVGDASERMHNLTDELRQQDDWPIFLGSAPIESFIKNMKDPHGVRLKVLNRTGRAVINHLKKANKQLSAHVTAFPRKNIVRLLLLINEDREMYDPQTVSYVLQHALRRRQNEIPLYKHIDGVLYMTERHATVVNNQVAFTSVLVKAAPMETCIWKETVIDRFISGWAEWNGKPLHAVDPSGAEFTTIDHIPDMAPLHERWRTAYQRRPYLRESSKTQLLDRFDESIVVSLLEMTKDSPVRSGQKTIMQNMEVFTYIMYELNTRGIPITEMRNSLESQIAAAQRLKLPTQAIRWIEELYHRKTV